MSLSFRFRSVSRLDRPRSFGDDFPSLPPSIPSLQKVVFSIDGEGGRGWPRFWLDRHSYLLAWTVLELALLKVRGFSRIRYLSHLYIFRRIYMTCVWTRWYVRQLSQTLSYFSDNKSSCRLTDFSIEHYLHKSVRVTLLIQFLPGCKESKLHLINFYLSSLSPLSPGRFGD